METNPPEFYYPDEVTEKLRSAGLGYWEARSQTQRRAYLELVGTAFETRLGEFVKAADIYFDEYDKASLAHKKWRYTIIIATGIVTLPAAISAILIGADKGADWIRIALSVTAAVAASSLGTMANLERFSNPIRRARNYLEAREMFLDLAREYDLDWRTNVTALLSTPQACMNASILNERLVRSDRAVRQTVKDLVLPAEQS